MSDNHKAALTPGFIVLHFSYYCIITAVLTHEVTTQENAEEVYFVQIEVRTL